MTLVKLTVILLFVLPALAGADALGDLRATLQRLQAWCAEAEATGIRALQDFSARMKGYAIATR